MLEEYDESDASFLDITYIQYHNITVIQWCKLVEILCKLFIQLASCLSLITPWLHQKYLPPSILEICLGILKDHATSPWQLHYYEFYSPAFGDHMATSCYLIYISLSPLSTTHLPPYIILWVR